MKLSELVTSLAKAKVIGGGDPEITRIDFDSRQVQPGSLFIAIEGFQSDGHKFLTQAFAEGAAAALVTRPIEENYPGPLIEVDDARQAMALLAGKLENHPDRNLDLVGVTGTNGKTTIVTLLAEIFNTAYPCAGMIGTLGYDIGNKHFPLSRTTPESTDLYRVLGQIINAGCKAAALEVSSHALSLCRVYGMQFKVAAFTNLSQDHLDFYGDFESYFLAKAQLFTDYAIDTAVINIDDSYGQRLTKMCRTKTLTFALNQPADVSAVSLITDVHGLDLVLTTPRGNLALTSPLIGRFNASNLACAIAICEALQIDQKLVQDVVSRFAGAPGRLEKFDLGGKWAYVDYAHSPQALEVVLSELRYVNSGPLHVVFGCGGNRDREKRPLMGRIAEAGADEVMVTSDNPRDEDPEDIIQEILAGTKAPDQISVIQDRRRAIRKALKELPASGILLIAGKGHEDYQEIKGEKAYFDDRDEVRRFIEESKS
ncbi:UDP-N-acetylmuramoyl-L-alanyl-D-glutamate--2,6-diaminopimelate ligase [bacterium]|nr:UDP-N-acetylmuramoyl-L-alanyl-D-glutamate--2,6-diaminopimelate ligase [bacterium]